MTDIEKKQEQQLILRAKKGDEKAFEEIINLYQKKICTTIYYMVKDESIVEDIAQEVFIKVYSNLSKFNEQSSLYTWIYRITMNACFDEIKKNKKVLFLSNVVETEDGEKEIEFEDPSQNVDEEIERKLERAELIKAIKELSEDQRALIILRDIRGFSYWEIADMLNIKLGTVKSKISRARQALKEILEKSGYFFEVKDEDN